MIRHHERTANLAPHELTLEDLTSDDLVFQIGIAPNRIDIHLADVAELERG